MERKFRRAHLPTGCSAVWFAFCFDRA
jgi:hypothetical protein